MRIGLVVNPFAGLGGAVGLKGTDGSAAVDEALRRGAVAQSGPRVRRALSVLAARCPGACLTVAPGQLGEHWADGLDLRINPVAVGPVTGTASDTRCAVEAFGSADLVVFAGGDGTARDVATCLPAGGAMLGIPAGVKMHSGVFALSPESAGHVLGDIIEGNGRVCLAGEAEIMDIDEEGLRAGHIAPRLFGYARVPVARNRMQSSKGGPRRHAGAALAAAAMDCAAKIQPGVLYVVGPGSSAGAFALALGCEPTLLGVDAFRDGKCLSRDATAGQLEALAGIGPVRIVLGVTGQQGFLLGRGNQQISAAIVRRAGRDGLIVLATEEKLAALASHCLFVDTGCHSLDAELAGYIRVLTDRGKFMMMRVVAS